MNRKRTHLNVLIDELAFVAFLVPLSTCLPLSYQLPPGSGDRVGDRSAAGVRAPRIGGLSTSEGNHRVLKYLLQDIDFPSIDRIYVAIEPAGVTND